MREILFRGWTIGEFSWEYGFLSWLDTPRERGYFINNKRIDERTLGQFTGMTDKNGTKIFEGDHDKDGNCVVFCDECVGWQFAQIDMPTKDICIHCYNCDGDFMFQDWIGKFEVVGNIHDNKDSLK